jgi:hypothetical protein
MSNINIKFYLVCQYFGIKSFIMGICIFPFGGASVISVIAVLPILRLTAGSITNGPTYGEFRKLASMVIAGGYTYATSHCFSVDTPTIIFEHLRMAFIKLQTQKKLRSFLLN